MLECSVECSSGSGSYRIHHDSIRSASVPKNAHRKGTGCSVVVNDAAVVGVISTVLLPSGYGFTAIADCAALTAVYPTTALSEQSLMTLLHDTPEGQHPLGQHIH